MSETEAKKVFKIISNGVNHCHQRGIVHCDLKPENILINVDEGDNISEVCINDFGLSVWVNQLNDDLDWRVSLPYLAPEMIDPEQSFGLMIDAWSLGFILYMLLTGSRPAEANSIDELAFKFKNDDIDFEK